MGSALYRRIRHIAAAVLSLLVQGITPFIPTPDSPEKAIILDIRSTEVLLAGLVGIALSVTGVTFQGIFRNPLVDPFILASLPGPHSGVRFQ